MKSLATIVRPADEKRTDCLRSGGDPDYERIGEQATRVCQTVDPRYTDWFLQAEEEARKMIVGEKGT